MFPRHPWLLAWTALVLAQDEPLDRPIPPSPFDREIALELDTGDPSPFQDHGPTESVEYTAEFEGKLHVWAISELDVVLQVEEPGTQEILEYDDASGGGITPYLRFDVRAGEQLDIFVIGKSDAPDATGPVALHLVASPETASSREVAAMARRMDDEARELLDQRDLAGARRLTAEALAALLDVAGTHHSQKVADASWNLAITAHEAGSARTSLEALARAFPHYARTMPATHDQLLDARSNLAYSLDEAGDPSSARVQWEAVLRARERTLPEDDPELLFSRANLAASLESAGEHARARALLESVLASYERTLPADHPDVLLARGNLASSLESLGDFAGARAHNESVLAVYERTLPADDVDLLNARASLAFSILDAGDIQGARALQEAVLAGFERTLPEDHIDLLMARTNLASSMRAMGDHAAARAMNEAAVAGFERIFPEGHPNLLRARGNLAVSIEAVGDPAAARAVREALLAGFERVLPEDHPDVLAARTNLATSMEAMGDVDGARALLESVLADSERVFPRDHPDLFDARASLAYLLSAAGELAQARALQEAVLEARERTLPEGHPDVSHARSRLVLTMAAMGDLAEAREHLPALCAGMRTRVLDALALAPRQARDVVGTEDFRLAVLTFLSESSGAPLHRVFELTETMRSVAGEAARSLARFGADPELAPILGEAASVRRTLNDLIATGGDRDAEAFSAELLRLSLERDRLERDARRRLEDRGVVTRPIEVAALTAALGEDEALVGYRRLSHGYDRDAGRLTRDDADRLIAHVLRADGTLSRVDLGRAAELAELAAAWRPAHSSSPSRGLGGEEQDLGPSSSVGGELRARLLDPVLALLGDEERRLHVCADGFLFGVPLDALPVEGGVVGDRWRLVNEVSFARLLAPGEPVSGDRGLLALGGVDYDAGVVSREGASALRDDASQFPALAETGAEARSIAKLFEARTGVESDVLEGRHATKPTLREHAAGKGYLHLATHGWFAPETVLSMLDEMDRAGTGMDVEDRLTGMAPMLLCGLALAGANGGRDSLGRVPGILTAEELCSLDLSQCELAVLSACETNVGIRRAGQGIQSLQAALYAAGARTSITSLWKVDDAATRRLMEVFYSNLWLDEMPKSEARWAAKKSLREEGHPPRDWAGWVMTGNPD